MSGTRRNSDTEEISSGYLEVRNQLIYTLMPCVRERQMMVKLSSSNYPANETGFKNIMLAEAESIQAEDI